MKTKLLFTFILIFISCSMFAQDQPVVQNDVFAKIPKATGTSDCSCSHWINKDLADQAESSTDVDGLGMGNDAIKFDNNEADGMYQEVEVLANTDYKFVYSSRINGDAAGTAEMEIRILKGSGYEAGYTPVYHTDATTKPTDGFGYADIADVDNATNNISIVTVEYPGNDDYNELEFTFNTGTETSIAIFARGIGNPTTAPVDGKPYLWSASDHETRFEYIKLTNITPLSTKDVLASKFRVYPNPARDFINVESKNIKVASVDMYNVLGAKVLSSELTNNRVNVSTLVKGVYFMKINADVGSVTKKVVVQ